MTLESSMSHQMWPGTSCYAEFHPTLLVVQVCEIRWEASALIIGSFAEVSGDL